MPVSNFYSLNFRVFVRKERLRSFIIVCAALRHCKLNFSGMEFHKIFFLILCNWKLKFIMFPSHIIARNFELHTLM